MKYILPLFFSILILCIQCKNTSKTDNQILPVFAENGINMVVEIPAGTNHKIEINKTTGQFENDTLNGQKRVINFLPYPGNYGLIPSTLMDEARGGDGDALDVLMIGESVSTGTVVAIKLIGALLLKDMGEIDTKLIAVPADSSKMVFMAQDFTEFSVQYPAAKKIIEDWFLNYKGAGKMELLGWRDEVYAMEEIKKWQK